MKKRSGSRGFTLVEILLVIVIIALILAVVIPRAWRAHVDSRFSLVRQAATELAAFGNQWA
jgi:prepilin-type N-terminal cleavage/methylation domain-containing protein